MGLYVLVLMGGNPVGGPMTGWMAEAFGGRSPFYIGGGVALVAALVCGYLAYRVKRENDSPHLLPAA